ncbi:MAG: CaiB/BaiF CoA-transferase family protein [Sphingobium sp.]
MAGPLKGLKVIEMAGLGPVPFCGMMLADMGADVIRVDRTGSTDLGIEFPTALDLRNRNKRSVAIDLKKPEGLEALLRLVEQADVLLEGFRPGVTERLGFGPDICLARQPRLVYGRGTGWGQEGPMAQNAGHDINYIALTGVLDLIGPAGGAPVVPLNLLGDYAGGAAYLAFGVICAVHEASRSGKGQVVDGAMVDGVNSLLTVVHAMRQAGQLVPERGQNILDGGAPYYGTYRTGDGRYVAIGPIEPRFYAALVSHLGLDMNALPSREDRANWPALREIFAAMFATRSRDEWTAHFESCPDACFSPVLSLEESPSYEHNRVRETMVKLDGVEHTRPAPRLSRTPGEVVRRAPRAGEHTHEILTGWGFSEEEIGAGLTNGTFAAS